MPKNKFYCGIKGHVQKLEIGRLNITKVQVLEWEYSVS